MKLLFSHYLLWYCHMRSEIIPIVAWDNYNYNGFQHLNYEISPQEFDSFINFFLKKKCTTDRPGLSMWRFNSLYICVRGNLPTHPLTHPPTHTAHRLFDCSDGDFWLRTWVAPRHVIPRRTREYESWFQAWVFWIPEGLSFRTQEAPVSPKSHVEMLSCQYNA
jgi:hypothetical protein